MGEIHLYCFDCGQPQDESHRNWCGLEARRELQQAAWAEGHAAEDGDPNPYDFDESMWSPWPWP